MAEVAVIGDENFVVGFQLAGIKNVQQAGERPFEKMKVFMDNKKTGMVIVDETTMEKLNKYERVELENSANPIFLTLSKKDDDERMRRLIIEAVGVDIWEKN